MNALWQQFIGIFATALESIANALSFLGANRYAAAIIVFTIAVKTILIPLSVKQIRGAKTMRKLQPELKRLQQKYRNDRQRLFTEMQELYRREGTSQFASCLPTIAQMPVLWAMYFSIRTLSEEVGAMPFFGLGNLALPTNKTVAGWVLIVIMTGAQILTMRQLSFAQDKAQQRLMYLTPMLFLFFMLRFPAGLMLYWTVQGLYQLAQQTIMLRGSKDEPPAKPEPSSTKRQSAPPPGKSAQPSRETSTNTTTPRGTNGLDRTGRPDGRRGAGRRRRGARPA